jgi:hypothetical protein
MSVTIEKPWFVIVERDNVTPNPKIYGKWIFNQMPPYAVGPYVTEAEAKIEANGEENTTYCLMTIDAKNEGYSAGECYWTQSLPDNAIIINPPLINLDDWTPGENDDEDAMIKAELINRRNGKVYYGD